MLRRLMMAGGNQSERVTWSPTDKSSRIVLSGDALTAQRVSGTEDSYATVRATLSRSSGKYYFEVMIGSGTPSPYIMIGVATSAQELSEYVGKGAYGWAYYQETGDLIHNGIATAYGSTYSTGDAVGVAVDIDAGEVRFLKNGIAQAGGIAAFTGVSAPVFPAVSLYRSGPPVHEVTGRFRASDFGYPVPAGYSPWDVG